MCGAACMTSVSPCEGRRTFPPETRLASHHTHKPPPAWNSGASQDLGYIFTRFLKSPGFVVSLTCSFILTHRSAASSIPGRGRCEKAGVCAGCLSTVLVVSRVNQASAIYGTFSVIKVLYSSKKLTVRCIKLLFVMVMDLMVTTAGVSPLKHHHTIAP